METRKIREAPKRWIAGTFLGLTMMVCGVMLLFTQTQSWDFSVTTSLFDNDNAYLTISRILLCVGGAIIFFGRKKGNYFAVGIYAMTLGISRVIRSLPNLVSPNDAVFYMNIVLVIVGTNLALGGYNHLTVRTRNPSVTRMTTIGILIVYLLIHLLFLYFGSFYGISIQFLYNNFADVMWYMPLYLALLFVLFSKEVINNAPMGRLNSMSQITAQRVFMGETVSVSEEDSLKMIEGFSSPSWKESTVGGIRKMEEHITFHTRMGERDVVLEKWDNDPTVYISVVDDVRDSFITGHRIKASDYIRDNGRIELIDESGVCASILISEAA